MLPNHISTVNPQYHVFASLLYINWNQNTVPEYLYTWFPQFTDAPRNCLTGLVATQSGGLYALRCSWSAPSEGHAKNEAVLRLAEVVKGQEGRRSTRTIYAAVNLFCGGGEGGRGLLGNKITGKKGQYVKLDTSCWAGWGRRGVAVEFSLLVLFCFCFFLGGKGSVCLVRDQLKKGQEKEKDGEWRRTLSGTCVME